MDISANTSAEQGNLVAGQVLEHSQYYVMKKSEKLAGDTVNTLLSSVPSAQQQQTGPQPLAKHGGLGTRFNAYS
jgi:hypothetical protein